MTSEQSQPRVAILLLNYKAAEMTLEAVESLQHLNYPSTQYEIHVIDNASSDGSVEVFQSTEFEITLHVNEENWGYAGGHNPILKKLLETRPDIAAFWLLNNDTTVDPDALKELVFWYQKDPKALIGSKECKPHGQIHTSGGYLSQFYLNTRYYKKENMIPDGACVQTLTGVSWLFPRAVFDEVGLLDERYFMYYEDNDYCFQARLKAWKCRIALQSIVYHLGSVTSNKQPRLMSYYYRRNRLLFLQRFLSPFAFKRVLIAEYLRPIYRFIIKPQTANSEVYQLALSDFKQGIIGKCPHKELYQ